MVLLVKLALLFSHCCIGFQTSYSTRSDPSKAKTGTPITATNQAMTGRGQPLKLTTITTLSNVFLKAQGSEVEAKKVAEIDDSDTENNKK